MAVIPKRLAAPKDHLVARLRFGTVSVMAWSDAFSNSGYRLAIHGSAVDLLGLRRKVPIGDLDLIAYVTDGTGNQACTLVESLLKCSMIELKNRVNGRPFGYHAKGESLGGTSTRWSFTIYTDHPPVSTFDNVANSQILFLDNRELRSKYGDISIMLFLQSTRQVFVPDGWAVSRLPLRVAHRETCGYRCLNPVVDGRVFDSGWPVVDPTRFVADIDATFRSHFSESDAPSFLRLFFFAYSRIERFSNSRTTNAVLWNYVSDHIANHAQLRFLSPAEFAHYLYQHAIVPDAFQMLSVPTVTYDALFATQAAWNSCTQPESRAHVMADFAKMIRSLLGRVCESDGRTPDWVIAHSWMIGSTGPERFFDVVVLPAIDRLAPQEKAYCILELLSGSRLTSDQLFRFDLSSPSLLARIVPELVAIERSDDATIRGRLNTLNRLVKHDPSALDLVGNDAAQTIVAAWIRSDGFPPELYSRVISPLRDRIPPSIKAQSVLDQITKGKMSIVEIESFAGLDLSILERYVSQLIGLLPSDPPTYLSTVELTVQRYPKAIEFAKSMAFRPIIDAWGAQSTPSLTQFHTLIAPLLAGMETTERLHYLSTWISNGKLDPIKLDENQRKNPDIVRAMILRLVDRLQIVSTKKKMLNTELSVIPVSGIRGPFTATSPEMILGGMVAEFLGRGVEINGGRLFLRAVIPDAVPGSPLAEMLPRLLPICAAPQFYDADIAPPLLTWAIRVGRLSDRTQMLRGLRLLRNDPAYYRRSEPFVSDVLTFNEVKAYIGECASDVEWIRKEQVPVIFDVLSAHFGKHCRTMTTLPRFILRHKDLESDTRIELLRRWCHSNDVSRSDPDLFLDQMDVLSKSEPEAVDEFLSSLWRSLDVTPSWSPFQQLICTAIPIQLRNDPESWGQMVRFLRDNRMPRTVVDGLAIPLVVHWHRCCPDWPEAAADIQETLKGVVRTLRSASYESAVGWLNRAVSRYSAAPQLLDAIIQTLPSLDSDLACRFCLDLVSRSPFPEVRELILGSAMKMPTAQLSGERQVQLLDRVLHELPTESQWIVDQFGIAAPKLGKLFTRDQVDRLIQWGGRQSNDVMSRLIDVTVAQMPRFLIRFPSEAIGRYVRGSADGTDFAEYEARLKRVTRHVGVEEAWTLTARYLDAYPDDVGRFIKWMKFELVAYGFQVVVKSSQSLDGLRKWFPLIEAGVKGSTELVPYLYPHFHSLAGQADYDLVKPFEHLCTSFLDYKKKKAAEDKKRLAAVEERARREFQRAFDGIKAKFQAQMDRLYIGLSTPSEQHPDRFPHELSRQLVDDFFEIDDLKMQRAILDTRFAWGREWQMFQVIPIIAQDTACLDRLKTDHGLNPVSALNGHLAISVPLRHDNVDFLNYMLQEGLDPNTTFINLQRNEVSIFEYAARCKSMKCVDALLDAPGLVLEGQPNLMPVVLVLAVLGEFELIEYIETRRPVSTSPSACTARMSQLFRLFVAKDSFLFGDRTASDVAINGLKYLLGRNFVSFNYPVKFNWGREVKPLSAALMLEATNAVHYDPDRGLSATLLQCGASLDSASRLDLMFIYAHALLEPSQNDHLKRFLKTKFAELGAALPVEAIRGFFRSREFLEQESRAVAAIRTIREFGFGDMSRFEFIRLGIESYPRFKAGIRELLVDGGGWVGDGSNRFSLAFQVAIHCPFSIFEYCHRSLAMPLTDLSRVESVDAADPILLNMAESISTLNPSQLSIRMCNALTVYAGGLPIFQVGGWGPSIIDYEQKIGYLGRHGIKIREEYRDLVNDIRIAVAAKRLTGF